VRGAWLLAFVVFGACTEPRFFADAGADGGFQDPEGPTDPRDGTVPAPPSMPDEAGTCEGTACPGDATPPDPPDAMMGAVVPVVAPDGGLDALRAPWVGRFATRSFLFSWDGLVESTARLLTLAEIKPTPEGGLVLEEELCLWEGGWVFIVTTQAHIEFPGTKASAALTFTNDNFESLQLKAAVGYGPAPSACTAGVTTTQAQPGQAWLTTNSCDCPRNADVPSSPRDCRLTDADKDRKPGYTFPAKVASSNYDFHVAQEERLRLLNGYRVGEQLFAAREFLDTTKIIECTIEGATRRGADCPTGAGEYCPAAHNKTEFVRIKPDIGCREIIQREDGTFTKQPPPFPAACRI
jgi:hypothetical protein